MLRSIYQRISSALKLNRGAKTPHRARPRRLTIESLECRKLLTATLTLNSISDGSFEAPTLAANSYTIAPLGSPWQFTGDTGISGNSSGFTTGNPNAPNGTQVAFLKNNGTISQSVYLDAGVYDLSFLAAQRTNFQTQSQEIEVLVDGAEVGAIVPGSTSVRRLSDAEFRGLDRHARRRTPRHELAVRRQHRLS